MKTRFIEVLNPLKERRTICYTPHAISLFNIPQVDSHCLVFLKFVPLLYCCISLSMCEEKTSMWHILHTITLFNIPCSVFYLCRRSQSVLTKCLPSKEEHIILVNLSSIQKELYNTYVSYLLDSVGYINPIKGFHTCTKVRWCWSDCVTIKSCVDRPTAKSLECHTHKCIKNVSHSEIVCNCEY